MSDTETEMGCARYNRGFTVIEIIMVILVVGIVSVVAIPKVVALQEAAWASQRDYVVGAVQSGLYMYSMSNAAQTGSSAYPATLDAAPNGVCKKRVNPNQECFATLLRPGITADWTRYFGGILYRHNDTNAWYWYRSNMGFFQCIANCWE